MSDDEIRSALTPEQWARLGEGGYCAWRSPDGQLWEMRDGARHATAALALYGQPFGFTHADLDLLLAPHEGAAARYDYDSDASREAGEHADAQHWEEMARAIRALAARIAALLPPEESTP